MFCPNMGVCLYISIIYFILNIQSNVSFSHSLFHLFTNSKKILNSVFSPTYIGVKESTVDGCEVNESTADSNHYGRMIYKTTVEIYSYMAANFLNEWCSQTHSYLFKKKKKKLILTYITFNT